jgi:hypothetical protein
MASWTELTDYVRANYKIADEQPDLVKMIFNTGGLRSQIVLLAHQVLRDGSEEWVLIESPVGPVAKIDLQSALRQVGQMVCGGAGMVGDLLTIRHAVPLVNLDINEFERPLHLVTVTADRLEKELIGGDEF